MCIAGSFDFFLFCSFLSGCWPEDERICDEREKRCDFHCYSQLGMKTFSHSSFIVRVCKRDNIMSTPMFVSLVPFSLLIRSSVGTKIWMLDGCSVWFASSAHVNVCVGSKFLQRRQIPSCVCMCVCMFKVFPHIFVWGLLQTCRDNDTCTPFVVFFSIPLLLQLRHTTQHRYYKW